MTKLRADELRPPGDSPKELITPGRLELLMSGLKPDPVDRLIVTEIKESSSGAVGCIKAHLGRSKGCVCSVV